MQAKIQQKNQRKVLQIIKKTERKNTMKNNIIKKVLAVILSVISIADILSLGGYAINNDRLDLSQYTMEDLCSMSSKEFRDLLTQFEKEYDPFGTYSEYSIMSSINDQADFNWSSGKYDNETGELLESGSHELITSYACSILANDKGFFPIMQVQILQLHYQ